MSASQHRNMMALFGCCLFIQLVGHVAAGVSYEASAPRSAPFFCEVNGKFYREGEHFTSASNPELTCQCRRGYTGRDVEPLCRSISRLVEHDNVKEQDDSPSTEGCVQITRHRESPKYSHYTESHRCPNDAAVIPIIITENLKNSRNERSICTFGNVRLGIADYFYHSMKRDTRNCVKCTCEQPPKPTCHRPPKCPLVRF